MDVVGGVWRGVRGPTKSYFFIQECGCNSWLKGSLEFQDVCVGLGGFLR